MTGHQIQRTDTKKKNENLRSKRVTNEVNSFPYCGTRVYIN